MSSIISVGCINMVYIVSLVGLAPAATGLAAAATEESFLFQAFRLVSRH